MANEPMAGAPLGMGAPVPKAVESGMRLFRQMATQFGIDTRPGAHKTPPEMWAEGYQVEFPRGFREVLALQPFMAGMHVG